MTGSGPVGAQVSRDAADSVKRVGLELGGKSANIILDDADPAAVAMGAVFSCFINSGQTCSALTRVLVPRSREQEYVDAIMAEASQVKLVDPTRTSRTSFHSLRPDGVRSQQETVQRASSRRASTRARRSLMGGPEQPEGFDKGFYVKPTVFADVTPDMTIAQEEIFGPVLSILTYEDEDDAVRIANGTVYGLAGGVQSADVERAKAVARRMRTGQVDINGAAFNTEAPFGGYKQSGNTRERGVGAWRSSWRPSPSSSRAEPGGPVGRRRNLVLGRAGPAGPARPRPGVGFPPVRVGFTSTTSHGQLRAVDYGHAGNRNIGAGGFGGAGPGRHVVPGRRLRPTSARVSARGAAEPARLGHRRHHRWGPVGVPAGLAGGLVVVQPGQLPADGSRGTARRHP